MYGKHFESMYTGSMVGAGATVFAVWGYIIAHAREGRVELNPTILAAVLGAPQADVTAAIDFLASPDERSRSKEYEGRRLVQVGEFLYEVPTHEKYRSMRDDDDRKEYMRQYMRQYRARKKVDGGDVNVNVNRSKPRLSQSESEAEADTQEKNTPPIVPPLPKSKRFKPPTLEAVAAYCAKRGNRVDPQAWLDHYTANGWKVGKNPMKDWQAAVRTWEKPRGGNGNGHAPHIDNSAPARVRRANERREREQQQGRTFDHEPTD